MLEKRKKRKNKEKKKKKKEASKILLHLSVHAIVQLRRLNANILQLGFSFQFKLI